ncbi:MAG TPA: hypothetical protein VHI50_03935 [Micromonosporaceae bacterium]|nr:hypothetical protein [Micromonosporaceae bacterium]
MTQPSNGDEVQRPAAAGPAEPPTPAEPWYPPAVDPYATAHTPPPRTPPPHAPAYPTPPGASYPPQVPPPAYPPPGLGSMPPAGPAPRKRRGLLITSIVLGVALLLCGGGGAGAWLYLNRMERGQGADAPEAAVEQFLDAVYDEQDADQAAELVCRHSRDKAEITKKVDEVKAYAQKYKNASFDWDDPKVEEKTQDRAKISVKVTASTGDEREAAVDLTFTVIRDSGWWVCEVGGPA